MVNNFKCVACKFQPKCVAFNKLKAFSDDIARNPIDVEITFDRCDDFDSMNGEEDEEDV